VTERTSWYRANAEKCLSLAHRFHDPQSKRTLLAMANAWLAMAEQSARNSKAPADTPRQPLSPDRVEPEGR
jgi:hypothetical protein